MSPDDRQSLSILQLDAQKMVSRLFMVGDPNRADVATTMDDGLNCNPGRQHQRSIGTPGSSGVIISRRGPCALKSAAQAIPFFWD
jgi:hypothetical protein